MRYKRLRQFMHHQATSGIILMLAALLAFSWANSPWADSYRSLFSHAVSFWVNDALMALFFLLVGLEIKREFLIGELSTRARALQPAFAALGGVIVPALIYLGLTRGDPALYPGWAIPCATDIAFALGILALLGNRVPVAVKALLTAIAILDDLFAIIVIALFYSGSIAVIYLALAVLGILALALLNRFHIVRLFPYLFVGAVIWTGFLKAGIHPTLAGVITALFIPLKTGWEGSPLLRLETLLHPWVAFAVLPLFALCNAGLSVANLSLEDLERPLTLGIMAGLAFGKPLGIMAGLALGHVTSLARKPSDNAWSDYFGMAFLCGIGFTMSLFIGELAFDRIDVMQHVKLGILSASLLSAAIGLAVCRLTFKKA